MLKICKQASLFIHSQYFNQPKKFKIKFVVFKTTTQCKKTFTHTYFSVRIKLMQMPNIGPEPFCCRGVKTLPACCTPTEINTCDYRRRHNHHHHHRHHLHLLGHRHKACIGCFQGSCYALNHHCHRHHHIHLVDNHSEHGPS